MILRILVLIGLICVPLAPAVSSATNTYAYEYTDQPTSGGRPVFATKADVMIDTIRKLVEAKDYAGAEKMAEEVTQKSPDMVDGWIMLGYTRSLNGEYEQSNDAYDKALEYGADAKDILLRKAYNCRKLDDPEKTRECFEELLEIDSDVSVLMQFGAFEASVGNYQEAARRYQTALEQDPANVDAVEALSRVEKKLGNTVQEKYWLEKGLSVQPDNPGFLKRLSLIYLNEQNYDLSIHYLDKLLAISPDDAGARRNLGIAYYQKGEKDKAKDAFEKVRALGGKLDGLYGPLADCYRSAGERAKALAVINEGIKAKDQEAWLYSIWGKLLEDQKEYDAAIGKFSRAVELRDEPWSAYAKKQIARQTQLKKRAELIAQQNEG
jgi:tetratricopeptide (TPR) repeat protein